MKNKVNELSVLKLRDVTDLIKLRTTNKSGKSLIARFFELIRNLIDQIFIKKVYLDPHFNHKANFGSLQLADNEEVNTWNLLFSRVDLPPYYFSFFSSFSKFGATPAEWEMHQNLYYGQVKIAHDAFFNPDKWKMLIKVEALRKNNGHVNFLIKVSDFGTNTVAITHPIDQWKNYYIEIDLPSLNVVAWRSKPIETIITSNSPYWRFHYVEFSSK